MSDIRFHINGKEHIVPPSFPPTTSLNVYLRETAGLKGTKVMCKEAGCGCCAVTVTLAPPDSDKLETFSVQSCITPLYAVDGWQINTIEGIGSQKKGLHPIQDRIAKFNGTQCGYCTPGMVMNMYGLLHQKPNISAQEVEDNFDGNICRCTGYRPILDAMKSFAEDANIPGRKTIDIEDLNKNLCPKTGESCSGSCTRSLDLQLEQGARWHRPGSLVELAEMMTKNKDKKIRLVFGNTSTGIYKNGGPYDVYLDLHRVKELFSFEKSQDRVRLGAATTLTNVIDRLKAHQDTPGFRYFTDIYKHLERVANRMVRNGGCIAGNLMIKYRHREFPSDVFTVLECAGAQLEIYDTPSGERSTVSLLDFLTKVDMSDKVITAVILSSLADNVTYRTFKITPRWQNAHAYVNAAFRVPTDGQTIKGRPSIVLGGISADTTHATKTEDFLENKTLTQAVVKEAYTIMKDELVPSESTLEATPKYRKDLAGGLLYKVLLGLLQSRDPKLRSGPENLHRPVSSGLQTFQEKRHELPLKIGMPKMESAVQASGEALYVNDMPKFNHELYGSLTLADVGSATIESIDATEALALPGVTHFLSAKDIIGGNNWMLGGTLMDVPKHEVFASEEVHYNGQPIGLVLAETQATADEAAKKVKVNYSEIRRPVLTIEESLEKDMEYKHGRKTVLIGDPEAAMKAADQTVEGTIRLGSQYHFYTETMVSLAVPSEDSIDLYSSTQFTDICHHAAALIIDKPLNYINITVPRLGGGFGGKSFDPALFCAAATLGAYISDRPVRLNMDLENCIRICGKRHPLIAKYKVGFTKEGDVQVVDVDVTSDVGSNDFAVICANFVVLEMDNGYYIPNWHFVSKSVKTNKKSMQPTRAPGAIPAALIMETMMEHVARAVNKHPIHVKEINLYKQGEKDIHDHVQKNNTMRELWKRIKDLAEVEGRMRHVDAFNQENTWKKRAITMTACSFGMTLFAPGFGATVTVFCRDGSVAITQGGIEMGQGLYTKVAQGVAHVLGIPLDNIKVKPHQGISTPNNSCTGASTTSEFAMQSAINAAEILKERMRPIREKFPDADWQELCKESDRAKIDMTARYFATSSPVDHPQYHYYTYCVGATETEIDVLTGESQVRRVDIMADYGESLNPVIDIGQTEGAYVMGLGNFLSEDTLFDKETGRILTDGTWTYKPPMSKDIPIDWRIHLLPDAPNPSGIRSSKASGEPPITLSVGALLANKRALEDARQELFGITDFIPVVAPFTPEKAQQSVGLDESALFKS